MRLCKAGGGGPFVDARLDFYRLHAHLWLLIALARAAKQQPALISRHGDFLVDVAANGDPHILIRGFAADAALTLVGSGQFDPSPEIVTALKQVNRSPFPPADAKALETVSPKESGSNDEDHGIHFGIDIGPHFFAPLALASGFRRIRLRVWHGRSSALIGNIPARSVGKKISASSSTFSRTVKITTTTLLRRIAMTFVFTSRITR